MRQLALDLGHRTALGREDFLVTDSNRAAVAWLDRWPDWPASALALHGPAGCGKTHLAHVWQSRSGAAPLAPGALEWLDASRLQDLPPRLVLDGLEPPLPPAVERGLLHLYNLTVERGGQLLLCARTAPARWAVALPDLASRLAAIPAIAVAPPDDRLIEAILLKLFADRQLAIGGDVVRYVAARMERSFAAAERLVVALDRAALAERRGITLPLARAVLAQLARE